MNLKNLFQAYRYELVAFLTGASVMILEIVGARLIAPFFGTSVYVWTAMIGVILSALAIGFAIGGKLADRYNSPAFISLLLFVAAGLILGMGLVQRAVLGDIAALNLDLRLSALLAAILLFGLPSLLIGMVSPHLAKIRVTSLDTTGSSIGKLEAAGAFGSIAGTFASGYFLLGAFGSRSIVIGIVVILVLTSFLIDPYFWRKARLSSFALIALIALTVNANPATVLADTDSAYARYRVISGNYAGYPVNMLMTDNGGIQSAAPTDGSDDLVLMYSQHFMAAAKAYQDPERVLVVGGGAYIFPSALVREYSDVHVDVAEIDPALDKLARDHFNYEETPRLSVHHADGRTYLNDNMVEYDMIYMDAFSSLSPPFQLTTREAAERIRQGLSEDGVAVVNLIGRYESGENDYIRAMYATYASEFKYVALHQTNPVLPLGDIRQNFTMVASNNAEKFNEVSAGLSSSPLAVRSGGLILTDNYAPIERLTY